MKEKFSWTKQAIAINSSIEGDQWPDPTISITIVEKEGDKYHIELPTASKIDQQVLVDAVVKSSVYWSREGIDNVVDLFQETIKSLRQKERD